MHGILHSGNAERNLVLELYDMLITVQQMQLRIERVLADIVFVLLADLEGHPRASNRN